MAIFTLTASMLYADQNLMAPLLSPIAAEFGFNDEEKYKYVVLLIKISLILSRSSHGSWG